MWYSGVAVSLKWKQLKSVSLVSESSRLAKSSWSETEKKTKKLAINQRHSDLLPIPGREISGKCLCYLVSQTVVQRATFRSAT